MQYRKSVNASDNIFTLSAGIYTVACGNAYLHGDLGGYGVLTIMPAEFNYVTALYVDSGANVGFGFCDLGGSGFTWNVLKK
jgi:hypothetical protein